MLYLLIVLFLYAFVVRLIWLAAKTWFMFVCWMTVFAALVYTLLLI